MKNQTNAAQAENPLGTAPVGSLIAKFAIPAIISMLVSALYNIVDQIFIGQGVGMLGNAATNIAFPVTIISTAAALLLGIGSASNYNLEMGAGNEKKASSIAGTGLSALIISGTILSVIVLLFLKPLLHFFGGTPDVMPYAIDYMGITAIGLPFYVLSTGGNHLIRADRSPTYSMTCILAGAAINTILDPLFIFGFGWGIKGAAWATVIGQIVSGLLIIFYFSRLRKMYLDHSMLIPKARNLSAIFSLGMASCINQVAIAAVQIVMNNTLRHYGALSAYGSDIPIACAGIISKVNQVFMAICIGISQGSQPIWGFNYGAEKIQPCTPDIPLFRNLMYCDRNHIFYLLPVLPASDRRHLRKRQRPVLSFCRKISPHLHADDLCQRDPAYVRRLFYLHWKSQAWCDHVPHKAGALPAAADRHLPGLLRNRWRHVRRTNCRYLCICAGRCFCQT